MPRITALVSYRYYDLAQLMMTIMIMVVPDRVEISGFVGAVSTAKGKDLKSLLQTKMAGDLQSVLSLSDLSWVASTSLAPLQGSWMNSPASNTASIYDSCPSYAV